ncbi:MAG: tRNA (adenosine(37)-N6)-dimethylallyltransferase MiaA [Gammaproteobacteria bacterium TMED119]|nr:MAG: tRNA (adenosine(37)-N6)-dimethylallyltransferase MiaA [Gammaproteobacteria bacterium TMED119]
MPTAKPVVAFIMGPTACGKTDLAVDLVQTGKFEIISVDSAMIYRGMDIGTAKPESAVLRQAPHHLINIRNPDESYSVAEFCLDANRLIDAVHARNKIPLLVGGTIMYFNALQHGLSELPAANPAVRADIDQQAQQYGWQHLHANLRAIDPQAAAKIHPNDAQRIQRALEVYELTQRPLSSFHACAKSIRTDIDIINFGLMPQDRAQLHARIAARFNAMLALGVLEELANLRQQWVLSLDMPAMRCIGYRQMWNYLEDKVSYAAMQDQAIAATRQLAKRQLTWLRHYPETIFIDPYTNDVTAMGTQINCEIPSTNC